MTIAPFHSEHPGRRSALDVEEIYPRQVYDRRSPAVADTEAGSLDVRSFEESYADESADPTPAGLDLTEIPAPAPITRLHPPSPSPGPVSAPSRRPRRKAPPAVRLGVVWGLVITIAVSFSPIAAAIVLAPVSALAALTAWRHVDDGTDRPWWMAGAVGFLAPIAAVFGPIFAVVVAVGGAVAVPFLGMSDRVVGNDERLRVGLSAFLPAAATASLVLADNRSPTVGLALLAAVCIWDASNHVMGTGETGGALGAASGLVGLAVLAIFLSGLFVVPFSGATPWILCGMVGVAAPLANSFGHRFVGGVRLPAWRRLDTLFVAGPLWVVASYLLLR